MTKPAAALLLALLLTSCADAGTGGHAPLDPAAAMVAANATSTAAGANVASTAAAIESTRQGAIFEATARAIATAAQVTAVANATATEQQQLDSVAAIGNATRDAIAADTLRMEATATAVHLQWLVDYDARMAARQERASIWWHWFRVVGLVLFAIGGYKSLMWLLPVVYERLSPGVKDENGRTIAVKKGYQQQAIQSEPVQIEDFQEPALGPFFETEVHTPDANFTIKSPTPAGFTLWLAEVLDNSRCEFSNNQRKDRGWHIEYYGDMIMKLRNANWLYADKRNTFVMTDYGKKQAKAWLESK